MADILHGSARTTPRVRAELQASKETTNILARQYGLSRTTVAKWRMAILKSLTFTTLPQPSSNPTLDRRARIIERLDEQKRLLADPNFTRTIRTSVKTESGRTLVEKSQRIAPWWRLAPTGGYVFFVRAGWKPIEFEKGKSAIAVPALDKLPALIDT